MPTDALSAVLAALEAPRRSGRDWSARCPAHDDRHASLSVAEAPDGKALVHCHAGCHPTDIVTAAGLTMADLFPPDDTAPTVEAATYDYTDADGRLLYQVVRFLPKTFRQRRPDGADGWTWNRDGTAPVLYRLPELRAADPRRVVLIVEGEKDADRLAALGFVATTNVGGAGKWRREYVDQLRGRTVAVLPDNDDAGRQHAADVARSLLGVAAEVRIVTLPDLAPKGDVSDWLAAGGTADGLKPLIRDHPALTSASTELAEKHSAGPDAQSGRMQLKYLTAAQLVAEGPEDVPWVIPPWVALGSISELDGRPKAAGKTTFLLHLVGAALDGRQFLGQPTKRTPVVLLSEQGPTSLRATLDRAGLTARDDLYLVLWRDVRGTSWPAIVKGAVELCRSVDAELLIVDTLPQFAGMAGDAENDAGAALAAMEPLQAAAVDGLAVVVSRHDRKGGGEVGESGRGSSAFAGAVDIVLALRRGDGESRPTIRHLHALSRFEETPDELVIELTDAGYVALGSAVNFAVEEAKAAILETVADEPLTTTQLVEATGLKRTSVQAALHELVAGGHIDRSGNGRKGDPHRFSRAAALLPEPIEETPIGPAESISQPDRAPDDDDGMTLLLEARRVFGDDLREGMA